MKCTLGCAAKALGWHVATPVFDGATEEDIQELLDAGRPQSRTARAWYMTAAPATIWIIRVTVGYMYYP